MQTRKSDLRRPTFIKKAQQKQEQLKTRSLNDRQPWIRKDAGPAIHAKLERSSSSSEGQIGNQRTPLGIAHAAEQPIELQASLLESLAHLLNDDEQKAAFGNKELLQCLAQMPAGQLDRKGNGFLKLAPPLALIQQLAQCGLGESAGRLIGLCPKAQVVQLACNLMSDPTQLVGVPDTAVLKCVGRAHAQLEHLANNGLIVVDSDPQYLKFHQLARDKGMLAVPRAPTLTFSGLLAQGRPERPTESGIDWDKLEHAGESDDFSGPGSFIEQDRDRDNRLARQAATKLRLLQTAFKAGIPTDVDRNRATKMLQGLCRSVALNSPGVLREMEAFARQYDLPLDPTDYWQAVIPADLAGHALKLQCDWPSFAAGDIKPGLDATGLDAKAFIHLQLHQLMQTPGADSKARLAPLYIAATIHGVHESPLLDFPPGTASLAFQRLLYLQTRAHPAELDSEEGDAQGALSHLVMASGEGVKRFKGFLSVALKLAKQLDLSTAVETICVTLSNQPDLRDALLRNLAAGGNEYKVLVKAGAALSGVLEGESDRGSVLSEFFLHLGSAYPLTTEIVKAIKTELETNKKAGKLGPGVEKAISTFIQGRLEERARLARDNPSPQVSAAYWKDFGVLLRNAEWALPKKTYKKFEKEMLDA